MEKLKKQNTRLNIIIGSFIGVFISFSIFKYLDYRKFPALYEVQSAPWHTSIQIYGIATAIVLLIAIILKLFIKKKLKNNL